MVTHINNNGGWTIAGWHRRGVLIQDGDDDFQLNADTAGHLVLLEPTNLAVLQTDEYKALLIDAPAVGV